MVKVAIRDMVSNTINNLGTKLSVISLIDVAAWISPINKPTDKATKRTGPATIIICQKAILRYWTF